MLLQLVNTHLRRTSLVCNVVCGACSCSHKVGKVYAVRVSAIPGLWTLDWTHGLDYGPRFGLDFGLMHGRRSSFPIIHSCYYIEDWSRIICCRCLYTMWAKSESSITATYVWNSLQSQAAVLAVYLQLLPPVLIATEYWLGQFRLSLSPSSWLVLVVNHQLLPWVLLNTVLVA